MFKIKQEFDRLGALAESANGKLRSKRFHMMSHHYRKYGTYGIYDSETKQYILFDTIMFAGHYAYNKHNKPKEFVEIEELIKSVL